MNLTSEEIESMRDQSIIPDKFAHFLLSMNRKQRRAWYKQNKHEIEHYIKLHGGKDMRKDIMLCYPYDTNRFLKWGSIGFIQPKLNGLRCRAVITPHNKVTLYSSQANKIISVPHINRELSYIGFGEIELDGELYVHGMHLDQIKSIVKRTATIHPDYELIEYHIFDIINKKPQHERIKSLLSFEDVKRDERIKIVRTMELADVEDIEVFYEWCMEEEYEGFIVRHNDAMYERRRVPNIMKCKPREKDSYPIVGYTEEKDIHGNLKGRLGALILEKDGQRFNVGSGLKDQQRQELWDTKYSLEGKYCNIKYQELSLDRKVPTCTSIISITNEPEEVEDE